MEHLPLVRHRIRCISIDMKKPAIQYHMTGKPTVCEKSGPDKISEPWEIAESRDISAPAAIAGGQLCRVRLKVVAPVIAIGRQDGIRGHEGRLDRGQDT